MDDNKTREQKVYEALLAHWDGAFFLSQEDKNEYARELAAEDAWKQLAPSEKLLDAACSLGECENVLDYGCGSGWAGIAAAKSGCARVVCADPAPNAKAMAQFLAGLFGVSDRVSAIAIDENWFDSVPDNSFDGFICSNVLDVVPPAMAQGIIKNAARTVKTRGRVMIGLNYYLSPERAEQKGMPCENGCEYYEQGVLRLVSRTDEEWAELFAPYFTVERLEHFAWPGEETETRRLFFLKRGNA